MVISCHVDLGSQCSLIKISKAKELGLDIKYSPNLPVLRGIGANLTCPVGMITAEVEVQSIKKVIDIYVVEDYVLSHPALLGHSFTEMPDLIITKTPNKLLFKKIDSTKVQLMCLNDICIPKRSLHVVRVKSDLSFTGNVYVRGSLRGEEDTTNVIPSEDLTVIRQSASENIKTQQLKDIERFNSRRKSSKRYEAGDLVRVERQVPHDGKSHKLVVKFQGPYRVIKVLPNERYVIEDTPMTRKHGRRYEAVDTAMAIIF
ncbi:hypothetical protein HW555_014175 [Spodoptera exigua]|uniref:Uncharacterized protein n=1 Tax=Spodoptera exigua TaxID=7107 RepID=A0A835G401_SPOEX|nr:hypothetical protein HW555_014175 [Spodoptera exigua]